MDTLTIATTLVVRMTGLLLFVPDQGTDGRPTHILMPVTNNMPDHVAQVGFYRTTSVGCDDYVGGVCYFDLDGYSLQMPAGSAADGPMQMSTGTLNLTDLVDARVPRGFLENSPPGDRVRSRITLPSGTITDRCPLANWRLPDRPNWPEFEMDNVVYWTIPDVQLAEGRLVLQRVPFNGGQPETILDVVVAPGQSFELFVQHVPRSPTRDIRVLGEPATHLAAYYDLLGVENRPSKRPIPTVTTGGPYPTFCAWPGVHEWSPTGVNCMIASALPADPKPEGGSES